MPHEIAAIFRRHQPRKHVQSAGRDGDVVIAAAKLHGAIFDDARAAPLRAIGRRQFLKPQHAMRNAVHGLVGLLGRQIVEQHHRGAEFCEIMLARENLPPVAQRALRQQPDFGKTVEHDPARPRAFYRFKNLLGGFAEFEVGRIKQALLLFGIQQAFRRQKFEHLDVVAQRPAVGGRAFAQFLLGFRKRDVEAFLAGLGALQQELQRNRRLAGSRRALDEEYVPAGKSAGQDIVQPPNPGFRLGRQVCDGIHAAL
jgi:hypothetical protein